LIALIIFSVLVILPIFEIYLLIQGAGVIGTIPVILLTIGTAALGSFLIKQQGLAAMRSAQRDVDAGQAPVASVVDGVGLLVAAPFLLTPGFITDGFGFLLLVPFVRHEVARMLLRKIQKMKDNGQVVILKR